MNLRPLAEIDASWSVLLEIKNTMIGSYINYNLLIAKILKIK